MQVHVLIGVEAGVVEDVEVATGEVKALAIRGRLDRKYGIKRDGEGFREEDDGEDDVLWQTVEVQEGD